MARDHGDFDIGRFVVRVRRLADLSQRELAGRVGLSQSGIAAIEAGRRQPGVDVLVRILAQADLRLCVLDADGRQVAPFPREAVRDNAGRRFPAHLDVAPPDRLPRERLRSPRYDREPAKGWYHLRRTRDVLREAGVPDGYTDHPTKSDLERRSRDLVEMARLAARASMLRKAARTAPQPESDECACEASCWGGTACVLACPCQCEPSPETPVAVDSASRMSAGAGAGFTPR